jgi:hypothetical protein
MSSQLLAAGLQDCVGIKSDEANLLANLSGGLPGKAIRLHEDSVALEQRAEWLDAGAQILSADRVQQFTFAEKASKDREALRAQLLVWLSFWRDVVLRAARSSAPLSNPDRAEKISDLAALLPLPTAKRALASVEATLEQLNTNVNARLVIEALLLELPSL